MVSINIENIGNMAGEEVVQLYIRDDYSSVTRPVKELKGFERVSLEPAESREISFEINPEKLAFYDINMDFSVEPGEFTILVGTSSADKDLRSVKLKVR